jgi:hypothetical protein
MMKFRTVRDSVRRLLDDKSAGEYRVIGSQKAGKHAESVLNHDRLVEVYFSRGDLPKSGGSLAGPNRHDITFRIDLTVSKSSEGDVAVLEDSDSTAAAMATALGDMKESGLLADDSIDELYELVYQNLMDARSLDLGLNEGDVASRWVSQLAKDEPIKTGNYTILTGSMLLTCTVAEQVTGYKGVTVEPVFNADLELSTDEPGLAGVQVGGS